MRQQTAAPPAGCWFLIGQPHGLSPLIGHPGTCRPLTVAGVLRFSLKNPQYLDIERLPVVVPGLSGEVWARLSGVFTSSVDLY